ncbi:hypothetical protein M758_2G225600 [Ceratodon purpureus]|nr:hypothetical protein M758_2G225600 [Ceratodon purpureus]
MMMLAGSSQASQAQLRHGFVEAFTQEQCCVRVGYRHRRAPDEEQDLSSSKRIFSPLAFLCARNSARGDGVWISLASEERLDILRRGVRVGFINWGLMVQVQLVLPLRMT